MISFMQKVNQKLDQKNQIIHKITLNNRKRPREYFHRGQQQIQLPIIQNTLYTSSKIKMNRHQKFISNLASRKLQNELDQIINGALKSFKNQKINKIIFANPLTHRVSLGKTYYKSSRYSTMDSEINSFYSLEKRRNFVQNTDKLMNVMFTPIKINKETDFIGRSDLMIMNYLNSSQQQKNPQPVAYLTAPEQIKQKPKMLRRSFLKQKSKQNKQENKMPYKYSPWNNNEVDELIIGP